MSSRLAARIFAALAAAAMAFQIALALGAPWGAYAMGGVSPGVYPPPMRLLALVNALVLLGFAGIVLARAGLALAPWRALVRRLIWIIVILTGVMVVLNLITPSALERIIWTPVAAAMFGTSLRVALGRD